MRKKPNRSSLPDGDIATVRAALRQFAHEGVPEISDAEIDTAIEEIARLAINPKKIGPLAKDATELLKDLSTYALSCSNSLKALDHHMKRMISFDENLQDDELDISFEPLASYSEIDGIEESEIRTESTLVNFLINRFQSLSEKSNNHVDRIHRKYDFIKSGHRINQMSSVEIIVFNCIGLIYRYYGIKGISLLTPTAPSPKKHNLSKIYRLVLTTYNFTFDTIYDPFEERDIFVRTIRGYIIKDEITLRELYGRQGGEFYPPTR